MTGIAPTPEGTPTPLGRALNDLGATMPAGEVIPKSDELSASPLGAAGARLWASVTDAWDLDVHEESLLRAACRTADLVERLDAEVEAEGVVIDSPQGRKAHPAAVELRQQRLTLARLLAALRMPQGTEGDQQATARPQRRGGARGVQSLGIAR